MSKATYLPPADNPTVFTAITLVFEVLLIILYSVGTDYESIDPATSGAGNEVGGIALRYPFHQDVNAMIYLGFGFLMCFLSRYTWSALGMTFFISALTVQWSILVVHFWHELMMMMMHWNPPSLLRLLTQDVFGITHTLCTDALAKITGRQQIDIHTATHLARGRSNRTTGAPSHTAAAHKDMERCSTCTAQRISADKASSLAQTSLHTDRTPSLGSPSIQEHAEAHPHTHTQTVWRRQSPHRVSITHGGSSHSLCANEWHSLL
jgi:hypothetical protein